MNSDFSKVRSIQRCCLYVLIEDLFDCRVSYSSLYVSWDIAGVSYEFSKDRELVKELFDETTRFEIILQNAIRY